MGFLLRKLQRILRDSDASENSAADSARRAASERLGVQTEPSDVRSLLDAVEDSTEGVVAALERLDERGLDAESELSDWTRRMIVAHLSYVATAYRRVSGDALLTGRSMTYPGRPRADRIAPLPRRPHRRSRCPRAS